MNVAGRGRLRRQGLEEGRLLDVGRSGVPGVQLAFRNLDRVPGCVGAKDVAVLFLVHGWFERLCHRRLHLFLARPDLVQVNRIAVAIRADRLGRQVKVYRAGQRIGHHQRRRGQVVGPHRGVDAPLEVAVAAQHRRGDQVFFLDGLRDHLWHRAAVADAGGAAIAHGVKAQGFQVRRQAGLGQVIGDDARARRQAGLDVGRDAQAALHRLLGYQPCADHHRRVGGVGAAGDRGDDDGAVAEIKRFVLVLDRGRGAGGFRAEGKAALGNRRSQGRLERVLDIGEGDAVLRPFGAGQAWLDRCQVEGDGIGELRLGHAIAAENALRPTVTLDQVHQLGAAPGVAQIAQRLFIHWEKAHGRAIFRRHVGNGGAVSQAHAAHAIAVKLDELADDAFGAQDLRHAQGQVRGGGALRQLTADLDADHLRHQHVHRLPQHGGLGFDTADAPAQHAQAVDHRGVRVGAHQGIGEGDDVALRRGFGAHDRGQVFQVDLVHDAGGRRHHAEVAEGLLAPAQKLVALAVALELALGVENERVAGRKVVHLHRMVNHQVGRDQGIDLLWIAAQARHGRAQCGQINHGRHAGEVLHDNAPGHERNLDRRRRLWIPGRQVDDVPLRDQELVPVAQRGFEQNLDRKRQARDRRQPRLFQGGQPVVVNLARCGFQGSAGTEFIVGEICHRILKPFRISS